MKDQPAPELAPRPWRTAPNTNGPKHPGEIRGPGGPVAYISLNVPEEQRDGSLRAMAAAPELLAAAREAVENAYLLDERDIQDGPEDPYDGNRTIVTNRAWRMLKDALAKAGGETP